MHLHPYGATGSTPAADFGEGRCPFCRYCFQLIGSSHEGMSLMVTGITAPVSNDTVHFRIARVLIECVK
jgi:hypothetical protein